jgi:hypothetical protein
MALRFITSTPSKLLSAFKEAIDNGHVDTWKYDEQGDFTHTPSQWKNRAWMRPSIVTGEKLVFNILRPKGSTVPMDIYAVYHGRFIESMIAHCNSLFTDARATPSPETGDLV